MTRPLRVLTLTDDLAPGAGRAFVGLGADVVRVVGAPDPVTPAAAAAALHWYAGQQTVVAPDDRALDALAAEVDVIVESGPAQRLRGVSFDADGVPVSRWPAVPHVVVTPFGLTGPKRDWLADDLVASAAGGMAWLGGHPDRQPKPPPREPAVQLAGAHAATGALLAVLARDRTGQAQLVDVSVQEAVAATLETAAITWIAAGRHPRRNGGVYDHVAHRIFATADGFAAGGYSGSNRMWTDLRDWLAELGQAEDLTDPVWDDATHRWANRPHVDAVVARFAARQGTVALAEEARRRALPWAEVAPAAALVDNPQLVDRRAPVAIRRIDGTTVHDVGFAFEAPGRPRPVELPEAAVVDAVSWSADRRAPALGAWADRARPGGVLTGLRVLDLTWVLAGPYATKQLAEYGADVIKIESIHRQDPTRFSPGMRLRDGATHEDGAYFMNFNRGKRSVAVNMKDPRGVAVVQRLARECDLVVENFAPGVLARWGLDHASLQADNPGVTVVSMAGVGQTGPWRNAVTFADTLAAMSGLSAETADPGGDPQGLTFGLGDMVAANAAVLAILDRLQRGAPGAVDLSQLEAMASTMGTAAVDAATGVVQESGATAARPNRSADRVPHGVYPAAGDDRWVAVSVPDDHVWRRLASRVPALAERAELDLDARRADQDAIDAALDAWTAGHDADKLAMRLQGLGVAASVVATGEDLVDHDTHLRARGFYPVLRHPLAGEVVHEGLVARLAATPGEVSRPAPLLGEHTDAVLGDLLDLPATVLADLHADAVLD